MDSEDLSNVATQVGGEETGSEGSDGEADSSFLPTQTDFSHQNTQTTSDADSDADSDAAEDDLELLKPPKKRAKKSKEKASKRKQSKRKQREEQERAEEGQRRRGGRRDEGGDAHDDDGANDDDGEREFDAEQLRADVDGALQNVAAKSKKLRGRKAQEAQEEAIMHSAEVREKVSQLIDDMREALYADQASIDKLQPALRKIQLNSRLDEILSKRPTRRLFVEAGGLVALGDWMTPYSPKNPKHPAKGTILTNLDLRKTIYKFLQAAPFEEIANGLEESKLGIVLRRLRRHPQESKQNKVIIEIIMDKWIRNLTNCPDSYNVPSGREGEAEEVAVSSVNL
eukprot:TRINITY_DN6379_c0_g1_i1.p1 TRINITY_DN6379_c0_g1~~TRINITY_DN6379_c0_g1_i1.p1  ORF type:complete len:351 (-),score=179.20 TRINITY_DN6379_c0_g1_i1:69-1091(-)